jgi:[protein-PII] uridylyltransferase
MHYADRPGKSAVERFMQFYFLNAKTVGDLTGLFLAQLDEQLGKKGFRFALPTIRRGPSGSTASCSTAAGCRSRPTTSSRGAGAADRAVRARRARGLEIHPGDARGDPRCGLIDQKVRDDPRANALFMEVLTDIKRPSSCCAG